MSKKELEEEFEEDDEYEEVSLRDRIFKIVILVLALLLIGYGVVKIGIPAWKYYKETKAAEKTMDDFLNRIDENAGADPSEGDGEGVLLPTDEGLTFEDIKGATVGIIRIDSINVQAPIAYGTTDDVLATHAGIFTEYDPIGTPGGNTAIAAHSSRYNYFCSFCYFQRIGDLVPGDEVDVIWKNGITYRYKVVEVRLKVDPNDFSAFQRVEGKEMLTLQTCTDGYEQYRTFVHAERLR